MDSRRVDLRSAFPDLHIGRIRVVLLCVLFGIQAMGIVFASRQSADVRDALVLRKVWPERIGKSLAPDSILTVRDIGGLARSPGGRRLAYIVRWADPQCNCYHQELRVLELESGRDKLIGTLGQPFSATQPNGSINGALVTASPRWSPDGTALAFIREREGKRILGIYRLVSGVIEFLDTDGFEPFGFAWGPNSRGITILSATPRSEVVEEYAQGLRDGFVYGKSFVGVGLPVVPREPVVIGDGSLFGSPRAATPTFLHISISGGGAKPARSREVANFASANPAYAVTFASSEKEGAISRDGLFVLEIGARQVGFPRSVTIVSRAGRVENRIAVETKCEGNVFNPVWNVSRGTFIATCAHQRIERYLEINPVNGAVSVIFSVPGVGLFNGNLGNEGQACEFSGPEPICIQEGPTDPPRIVLFRTDEAARVLADPNTSLRLNRYGKVERYTWPNAFGTETWGYLVYPPDYEPARRYPLVLVFYNAGGFLRGGTGFENPIHAYADAGFLVFNINFPYPPYPKADSSHRAVAVAAETENAWDKSIQSSIDIAISALVRRGMVDPERVAYTGLSRGATQIDFALSNGRKMAVAISSTCCIDPNPIKVNPANYVYRTSFAFPDMKKPLFDPEFDSQWNARAPALHVHDIQTAILVNAAESESGSKYLWGVMRQAGKPVEFIVYADEHHIKRKPLHLRAIFRRNLDWLRFWLQGYEDHNPRKAAQYTRWRAMRMKWKEVGVYTPGVPHGMDAR